jgi:hypothetical protein
MDISKGILEQTCFRCILVHGFSGFPDTVAPIIQH